MIQHDVDDDQRLLSRCLQGSSDAWTELYRRFHYPLVTAIKSLLGARSGDRELVDEIAARVWYDLVRNDYAVLARFDPERNCRLTTFLAAIARNQIRTLARSELRRRAREVVAARNERGDGEPLVPFTNVDLDELAATLSAGELEFLHWSTDPNPPDGTGRNFAESAASWRYRLRGKIQAFLDDKE